MANPTQGNRVNWAKVTIAGVAAGVVVSLVNYLLYGVIMADTYRTYSQVFSQEQASPLYFFGVSIAIAFFFAVLFAKTRNCWAAGAKGGMVYGFWLGMVAYFANFYDPLVLDGFPYYLAWCHGGIGLIGAVVGGAVAPRATSLPFSAASSRNAVAACRCKACDRGHRRRTRSTPRMTGRSVGQEPRVATAPR